MNDSAKRRWFQFSLKAMLVVMTLLCIGPGSYVAYEQRKAREQRVIVETLTDIGAEVYYDATIAARSSQVRQLLGDERSGNVWLISFEPNIKASDDDLANIGKLPELRSLLLHDQFSDAGLQHVSKVRGLLRLDLSRSRVTDTGLARLSSLTHLERLFLSNTAVTDFGVTHICGHHHLQYLYLNGTQISDSSLAQIGGLSDLTELVLDDTPISDEGLAHLKRLKSLKVLSLTNTNVSEEAVSQLRIALPNATVFR